MKYFSILALAGSSYFKTAEAVDCYACTASLDANADNNRVACWSPVSTAPSNGVATAETTGDRCFTAITFNNGYPISITRSSGSDGVQAEAGTDASLDYTLNAQTCSSSSVNSWRRSPFDVDDMSSVDASTTCMYDCASDNCNSQIQLSQYTMCSQIEETANKWCDFTSGTWQCLSGYYVGGVEASGNTPSSAQTCEIPTVTVTNTFTGISCVQCNSMIDGEDCFTKTTTSACNDETYVSCFSTSAVTYERHSGDVKLQTVTKGCSTESAPDGVVHDQCFWNLNTLAGIDSTFDSEKDMLSDNWDHGYELVCTQRCDPSGSYCDSSSTPNGVIESETVYCAQYDSDDMSSVEQGTDLSNYIKACPSGTTGCYSMVTYLKRAHNHFMYPDVKNTGLGFNVDNLDSSDRTRTVHQMRGCLSTSAPEVTENSCEEDADFSAGANVNPMVTRTTCMESCEGNMCNAYTWPNRPLCLQSDQDANGIEVDMYPASPCPSPADDVCYIAQFNFLSYSSHYFRDQGASEHYTESGADLGFTTKASRGCAIKADDFVETGCNIIGMRDDDDMYFESCNYTCNTNSCNFGTAYSSAVLKLVSPVVMMVAMLFSKL